MVLTVPGLVIELRREFWKLKSAVKRFGLSPTGRAHLHEAIARFEAATEADLTQFYMHQTDVRDALTRRLENVRDLPRAIREQISDAHDAGWLATWMNEAEGESESGLNPAVQPWAPPKLRLLN